jgi:hypothetical protein
LLAWLVVQLLA